MSDKTRDKFLFQQMKEILAFEWDRNSKLDDKAVSIATSAGAILTIFFGLAPFTFEIIDIKKAPPTVILLFIICLICLVCSISTALFSIQPRSFQSINIKLLIDAYANDKLEDIIPDYGGNIINMVTTNSTIIEGKAKSIEYSLSLLTSGIFVMLFYFFHILILIYLPA